MLNGNYKYIQYWSIGVLTITLIILVISMFMDESPTREEFLESIISQTRI